MSNLVTTSAIENALIKGDLSGLTSDQRLNYMKQVCDTVGLNYLTKPFEYMELNRKLVLYATRAATDQLRTLHKVSIKITSREKFDDIYVVTAQAQNAEGRYDESTGAVNVKGLSGEALANAFLKCETKAKRRVTLSICGLGLLDETEVASIQDAKPLIEPVPQIQEPKKHIIEKVADVKAQNPKAESIEELGEYVVQFGKKLSGQKLKNIDPVQLESYLFDYLERESQKKNQPLTGNALELFEKGSAYLKLFVNHDKAPNIDEGETMPL